MAATTAADAELLLDLIEVDAVAESDKYLPPVLKDAIDKRKAVLSNKPTKAAGSTANNSNTTTRSKATSDKAKDTPATPQKSELGFDLAVQDFNLASSAIQDLLQFSVSTTQETPGPGAKPKLFKKDLEPETFKHLNCRVYNLHLGLFKSLFLNKDDKEKPAVSIAAGTTGMRPWRVPC